MPAAKKIDAGRLGTESWKRSVEPEHEQRLHDESAAEGVEAEQRGETQHDRRECASGTRRRCPACLDGRAEPEVHGAGDDRDERVEHEAESLVGRQLDAVASAPGRPEAPLGERPQRSREVAGDVVPGEEARCARGPTSSARARPARSGRKTLTSPADGFSVPSTATTSSGQNDVSPAKPIPVANMSADAPSSTRRRVRRWPARPSAIVRAAEPRRVPATIAPTSNGVKPRRMRYPASRTLTRPSVNPRSARTKTIRPASRLACVSSCARCSRWAGRPPARNTPAGRSGSGDRDGMIDV